LHQAINDFALISQDGNEADLNEILKNWKQWQDKMYQTS
jgi:hypothetical protein